MWHPAGSMWKPVTCRVERSLRHTDTRRCLSIVFTNHQALHLKRGSSTETKLLHGSWNASSRGCVKRLIPRSGVEGRKFLSTSPPPEDTDFSKVKRLEDANPERIRAINVNPDSIGSTILPGNLVYKHYKWTGNTRKVPLELVHGYFWMLNDLKITGGKPSLPNDFLIPEEEAQTFPMLTGLESLSRVTTDLPFFFIANKGEIDLTSIVLWTLVLMETYWLYFVSDVKCTLVNISFRDSGYKNISSWMEPFLDAFSEDRGVNSVKVSITERWSLYMLRSALTNLMRRNTPPKEHDNTLLYFGSDVDDFRDMLRMHNLMANYVFLVDALGRIRFSSSGQATTEEIDRVIRFAKDLSSSDRNQNQRSARKRR